MGRGEHLGEFEQLVLLAVLSLADEDAYGMNVRHVLEATAGREVAVPTVYAALDRLEAKGLVRARLGAATAERGGRAKRLFRVEPAGITALQGSRWQLDQMWRAAGIEPETP